MQLVEFSGGLAAQARISGHLGWRGPGSVAVGQDGVEFRLGRGFVTVHRQFVERADLDFVYPVEPRRWSLTNLVAGAVESLSKTGVRFVTQPVGMFADRDDFLFYSYRHQEWELIDLLQELGYPVDKKPKTLRLFWGDET